ncbi:MAG: hypothetical protein HUU23_15580 [Caldilineales bacterium]|nr:hypothetical protein [Caldilineales bacterium]
MRRPFFILLTALILGLLAAPGLYAAVTLKYFRAEPQANSIRVVWETATELDTISFFLLRAESEEGTYSEIADFDARGTAASGALYEYIDSAVTPGVRYWYQLEDLDAGQNSTFHGPVWAGIGLETATPTPSATPTTVTSPPPPTATPTPPPTATATVTSATVPSATVTTSTPTSTATSTATATTVTTSTPTSTATVTATATGTATSTTVTPTATGAITPTATGTATETTVTPTATGTATVTATLTMVMSPTATPVSTPTLSPTATPPPPTETPPPPTPAATTTVRVLPFPPLTPIATATSVDDVAAVAPGDLLLLIGLLALIGAAGLGVYIWRVYHQNGASSDQEA